MEFLYMLWRCNSSSQNSSGEMRKRVGLIMFDDEPPFDIVFSTRNLTRSITEVNKTPSEPESYNHPRIGTIPPPLETPCLLSSHGMRRGNVDSLKPEHEWLERTVNLLPLTVCMNHGKASFLPLDYVRRMGEYTCITSRYPVLKVVHRFDDCILVFPLPPPIGSSEERCSKLDYSRSCYQCLNKLSNGRTVYVYRGYLFCSPGCRLKACVARYWYKKAMKSASEDGDGDSISTMETHIVVSHHI